MALSRIHPTAVIDPKAELDPSVEVGPYSVIEAGVQIGPGTRIGPHVHIQGMTVVGGDCFIGTFSTIGHAPQHIAYRGEPRWLRIGDRTHIREYVTIHRAYQEGQGTTIGTDCMLMDFAHIGHDCHIGNGVIMVNNSGLAGHAEIGDRAFISGYSGVHQFCRVGRLAFIGGFEKINKDVPPFVMIDGEPARIRALNSVGLRRAGFSADTQKQLRRVFKHLYLTHQPIRLAIAELASEALCPEARELIEFYDGGKRGVISGPGGRKSKAPSDESPEA